VFSLYCQVIFISVIFYPKLKKNRKFFLLDMGIHPTLPTALWLYYT